MQLYAKPEDNLNILLNTPSDDVLIVNLPENAVFNQKVCLERDDVVINGNNSTVVRADHNGMREGFGTGDSATFTITSSNVDIRNLNFKNSFDYFAAKALRDEDTSKGMGLQAVALYTTKDADNINFENCCFTSCQDTLYTDGINNFFHCCTIMGNVDFIFGKAHSVFSSCRIISVAEGIVAAPSTQAESDTGLVFDDCDFICSENVPDQSVFLARPWHPGGRPGVCSAFHAKNCRFGNHIKQEKWTVMTDSKGVIHYPSESRFSIV